MKQGISKENFLNQLMELKKGLKGTQNIRILVINKYGEEDKYPIDRSEIYEKLEGFWCSEILPSGCGARLYKSLKILGKHLYDFIIRDGDEVIIGVESCDW